MSDMKDAEDAGNPAVRRPDPSRHIYGPRPVSALLPTLTRPVFRKRGAAAAQLIADWEAIVGPKLAQSTAPRKFSAGTLAIACAGPVALELQHLSAALIGRINAHAGHALVQRLRFVQEALPPPPPGRAAVAARDPAACARAEAAVADLPPGELRDALAALGRAVLTTRPQRRPSSGA